MQPTRTGTIINVDNDDDDNGDEDDNDDNGDVYSGIICCLLQHFITILQPVQHSKTQYCNHTCFWCQTARIALKTGQRVWHVHSYDYYLEYIRFSDPKNDIISTSTIFHLCFTS